MASLYTVTNLYLYSQIEKTSSLSDMFSTLTHQGDIYFCKDEEWKNPSENKWWKGFNFDSQLLVTI